MSESGTVRVNTTTLRRLLEPVREQGRNRNVPLESRCVNDLDYDLEKEEMTLEFVQRGTYKYSGVPLDTFVNFAQAESQGRYFNLYIRDKFYYERVA